MKSLQKLLYIALMRRIFSEIHNATILIIKDRDIIYDRDNVEAVRISFFSR